MGGGYSQDRYSLVILEYRDDEGNHPVWLPNSKQWSLGFRKVSLTELGDLCKISKEELILIKLKYGG